MQPHKIKSAFKSGGTLISPPGKWTPPNQAVADRLIASQCLRPPPGEPSPDDAGTPQPPTEPTPAEDPPGEPSPAADRDASPLEDKPGKPAKAPAKGKGGKKGRK